MKPGDRIPCTGNITTLIWVGARTGEDIEKLIGYGAGRLADGYAIALLLQRPTFADFEFDGTTLRSDGREGKPLSTPASDKTRIRVHDRMMEEYGKDRYRHMQETALNGIKLIGTNRIVKVLPVKDHNDKMRPDVQYPMGGGGLQWKLIHPLQFLVAAIVDKNGDAATPAFTVNIASKAPYDNRDRLMKYLSTVT